MRVSCKGIKKFRDAGTFINYGLFSIKPVNASLRAAARASAKAKSCRIVFLQQQCRYPAASAAPRSCQARRRAPFNGLAAGRAEVAQEPLRAVNGTFFLPQFRPLS
jgi:hypothetical protein